MNKKCFRCKKILSEGQFSKGRNNCNECEKKRKREHYRKHAEYYRQKSKEYKLKHQKEVKAYAKTHNKIYREKNKEQLREYQREWFSKNKERAKIYHKLWCKSNNERTKQYAKRNRIRIKAEVLFAYGGKNPKCVCCGEKDVRFLTIDHIYDNGAEERKRINNKGGGYNFYFYLRSVGFPKHGYQILCYNCNCGRRYYSTCPHKIKNNEG